MTYIQEIEARLRALLSKGSDEETVAWVKERILESYRNGQAAKPAGEKKRDFFPKSGGGRSARPRF